MSCQYLLDRQEPFPARTRVAERRVLADLCAKRDSEIGGDAVPFGARRPVALLFPNTYAVGMANLGVHWVWWTVHGDSEFACERFFLDHLPARSVENQRPLGDFPLILISCAFELDFWNIARALLAAGIPLRARERAEADGPVVVIGGLGTTANRLPLFEFADAFAIGDGEITLPAILDGWRASDGERDAFFDHVEGKPGIEIPPRLSDDARARLTPIVAPPDPVSLAASDCSTQILSPHTEFPNRALIEISRGCPHRCAFCLVGHRLRPHRARPLDQIWSAVERWRPHTDRFGFVSSAVASHPQIDDLCRRCLDAGLRVSFSSLRAEDLTPLMIETLVASDQRTLTLAPEVASPRLRSLIHKRIDDATLEGVISACVERGVENIKLYYLIGLPGETDDDALAIAAQATRLRARMTELQQPRGRLGDLSLNVGIFVPKAGTPLADHPRWDPAAIRRRRQNLLRALRPIPNTRVAISGLEEAMLQCLVSLGGIEMADFVETLAHDPRRWRRHVRGAFPISGQRERPRGKSPGAR